MTIPSRVTNADRSIESRLAEVCRECRLAIRDLTACYNFATDDRELNAVVALFTEGGSFVCWHAPPAGRCAAKRQAGSSRN